MEVRPALKFESLIETMLTLAAEGKTNRKGIPNPLRRAVIADAHFDTVRLPFPLAAVRRAGIALGALLGKLLGYPASFAETELGGEPDSPALPAGRQQRLQTAAHERRLTGARDARRLSRPSEEPSQQPGGQRCLISP